MKIKNSWLILKHFGYDKKLDLIDDLFNNALVLADFVSVELREKATNFLRRTFARHCDNNFLTQKSLRDIFEPLDVYPDDEIRRFSAFAAERRLSLGDWELFWSHLVYSDYKLAHKYLYYIGLEDKLSNVMRLTK